MVSKDISKEITFWDSSRELLKNLTCNRSWLGGNNLIFMAGLWLGCIYIEEPFVFLSNLGPVCWPKFKSVWIPKSYLRLQSIGQCCDWKHSRRRLLSTFWRWHRLIFCQKNTWLRLDHSDGKLLGTLEWSMVFVKVPFGSMVFQWFFYKLAIVVDGYQPLVSMAFPMVIYHWTIAIDGFSMVKVYLVFWLLRTEKGWIKGTVNQTRAFQGRISQIRKDFPMN